ncbi:hypothetical protein QYM36_007347 [Artemia franciscana]|uniref:Uncharacterized protein n=1 Tax=Artemia franciscana TaxID=6661 RepID=A0AA88HWN0_ARTSF|nr:hypothetical protein QYM36_007347 [Artemia franciscana]
MHRNVFEMSEARSCTSQKEQDFLYKNILAMSERTSYTEEKKSLAPRRNMGLPRNFLLEGKNTILMKGKYKSMAKSMLARKTLYSEKNVQKQTKERKILGVAKVNRAKFSITKVCKEVLTKTEITRIVTTRVEKRKDMEIEDTKKVDLSTLKREMEVLDADIRHAQHDVETLEVELQKFLVQKEIDQLQRILERN